jgi:hypothetical protein
MGHFSKPLALILLTNAFAPSLRTFMSPFFTEGFLPLDVEAEFERQRERVRQFIDDLETASKRP